jgi:hypothetical protein
LGAVGRRQGRRGGQGGEPRCMQHVGFGGSGRGSGRGSWRRGGLGSVVVSLVGAWGAWWGPGGRRGDGVHVGSAYAKTTSKKPRHATKSKLHADSDCFTCTRATRVNPNRHSSESKDQRRKLGLKSPPWAIPNLGASHEIKPQPRFSFAMWTCRFASQPTCHDRASRGKRAAR